MHLYLYYIHQIDGVKDDGDTFSCPLVFSCHRPRTGLETAYITVGMVEARSVDVKNTHTHATRKQGGEHKVLRAQVRFVQVERVCPLCRV